MALAEPRRRLRCHAITIQKPGSPNVSSAAVARKIIKDAPINLGIEITPAMLLLGGSLLVDPMLSETGVLAGSWVSGRLLGVMLGQMPQCRNRRIQKYEPVMGFTK